MNSAVKSKNQIFKHLLVQSAFVLFSLPLFLPQCVAQEEYEGDETTKKSKANQGADFFGAGQGRQDFFAGRNLSSNSVFTSGGSTLNLAPVIEPVREVDVSSQEQSSQQESDSFVANPNQEIKAAEEKQSSDSDEDQTSNTEQAVLSANQSNSNLDPNLRDVMEHSRKIREAIFGEEAASKLPASIRQRLQNKAPQIKEEGTRF